MKDTLQNDNWEQQVDSKMGFVYVMKNHRNGFYKIGFSKNPEFREKTLQSEEPEISLLFKVVAQKWGEDELHKIFQNQRVRGEWFILSDQDIDMIESAILV